MSPQLGARPPDLDANSLPVMPSLLERGNIDVSSRPSVQNPDGSISTIRSISINQDGREILIPTVVNGKVLSNKDAIDYFQKTGENLGKFKTPEEATAYAQLLHQRETDRTTPPRMAGKPPDLDASGQQVTAPSESSLFDATLRAAGNVAIGAVKQPGRLVQMIPGVAAATDKLYGLPQGASAASMQPSNTAQRVGGYVADAAELGASLGADLPFAASGLNPALKVKSVKTIGGAALDVLKPALDAAGVASEAALKKAYVDVVGKGPLTAQKVGTLVGKYGVKAVKAGLAGLGLSMGWDAWQELHK